MNAIIKTSIGDFTIEGVKSVNQCNYNKLYLNLMMNSRSAEKDLESICTALNSLGIKSEVKSGNLYIESTESESVKIICENKFKAPWKSFEENLSNLRKFVEETKKLPSGDNRLKHFVDRRKSDPRVMKIIDKYTKKNQSKV